MTYSSTDRPKDSREWDYTELKDVGFDTGEKKFWFSERKRSRSAGFIKGKKYKFKVIGPGRLELKLRQFVRGKIRD